MDKVKLYINGTELIAPADASILEAANAVGIHIPTLCAFKDYAKDGLCRICLVEIEREKKLFPACSTKVQEGMSVLTHSDRVVNSRKKTLDLIFSAHRMDCEYCSRYGNCELHALVREHGLDDRKYMRMPGKPEEDSSSPNIVRDNSKCVQCRRCVSACAKQGMDIITALNRGNKTAISSPLPMSDTDCIGCGQCVASCPTGALSAKDNTTEVWKAIRNHNTHVLAIVSPHVAKNIGCHLHGKSDCEGKLVALLHRMGFDTVLNTENACADGYIKGDNFDQELPAVSSACPSTAKYIRDSYPELANNIVYPSTGAANIATAFKESMTEKAVFALSISPCTAAKHSLGNALDAAITTAELENMIQRACLSRFTMNEVWSKLPNEDYDVCPDLKSGEAMKTTAFTGLGNAPHLITDSLSRADKNTVLEIMACPGGCENGGGRYLS